MATTAIKSGRPAPYRIKDLVEKTGITKETIHFYISEGLLPRAKKTSRNMAWYGDEHIERLRQIKELQEKQFLPLKAIKAVLNDEKDYPFTPEQQKLITAIQRKMNAAEATAPQTAKLDEIAARYKITAEEIAEFVDIGMLEVDAERGEVRAEDEEILRIWADLRDIGFRRDRGFTPRDAEMFLDIIDVLFNQEVERLTPRVSGLDEDEGERMLIEGVMRVNELLGHLHLRKIKKFVTGFSSENSGR